MEVAKPPSDPHQEGDQEGGGGGGSRGGSGISPPPSVGGAVAMNFRPPDSLMRLLLEVCAQTEDCPELRQCNIKLHPNR